MIGFIILYIYYIIPPIIQYLYNHSGKPLHNELEKHHAINGPASSRSIKAAHSGRWSKCPVFCASPATRKIDSGK